MICYCSSNPLNSDFDTFPRDAVSDKYSYFARLRLFINEARGLPRTVNAGHLGWCDSEDACGPPGWAQNVALDFLAAARETA